MVAAAQAGVALRRALRRFVSRADATTCREAARELVTVALSGDGGDELWAGYARHRVERAEQRARTALGPARTAAGWLGMRCRCPSRARARSAISRSRPEQAYALKHAYGMFEPRREGARSIHATSARSVDGFDPLAPFRDIYRRCGSSDPLDRALYVDVNTYMVDDILTKVDRMSMAVSLEAREPLLDHRLLEFAAAIPTSLKLKNGRSKYLLRKVLERRVPALDSRARQARLRRANRRLAPGTAGPDGGRIARRRTPARQRHLQSA